jgi:hypothetical protein
VLTVLGTVGSSLSPARGRAGARDGIARSGRPEVDGISRAGICGAGTSRAGRSAGRVGVRDTTSSGRGGSVGAGRPSGDPVAAMAGTRLITYVFG